MRIALFLTLSFLWISPALSQPTPTECTFPVDGDHDLTSQHPAIAYGDDAGFLTIYVHRRASGATSKFGSTVLGRLFDPNGNYVGIEFPIAPFQRAVFSTTDVQRDTNGDFVAGWSWRDLDGPGSRVEGRRIGSDGTVLSDIFQVNNITTGFHRGLKLATSGSRVFYVWSSDALDSDGGIVGRLGDLDGNFLGNELAINAHTTGVQSQPAIDVTPSGDFVVSWRGEGVGPGEGEGVFLRTFDLAGTPLIDETRVNSSQGEHTFPEIGHDSENLLLVWNYRSTSMDFERAHGQLIDATALTSRTDTKVELLGTELQIFSNPGADILRPKTVSHAEGEFMVVWFDGRPFEDYEDNNVSGRTVSDTGILGPTVAVTTHQGLECLACNLAPNIAASPVGDDFVVTWSYSPILGLLNHIRGQRFDGPLGVLTTDLALDITEEEDPTEAQTGFRYFIEVENRSPCPAENAQVEMTLPPQAVSAGYFVSDERLDCDASGNLISCTGSLPQGLTEDPTISVQNLPNLADQLVTSGTVSFPGEDPDLSNNSDTEITQVIRCNPLTLSYTGSGMVPTADPEAPCEGGRFAPDTTVTVSATPATDGWRVGSWTGTDDDTSTSRFNTVTMGPFAQEVTANYVFDGGTSWWTGDEELIDRIGPNDLALVGSGDPFRSDGEQGPSFFPTGTPVLEAAFHPSMNLGDTFSIGFWIRSSSSSQADRTVLDHRIEGNEANIGYLAFLSSHRPALRLGDGTIDATFVANRSVNDDAFHHVVYTYDQGLLNIYIDGMLDSQHDASAVGSRDNSGPLTLGSQSIGPTRPLSAFLDEVFISSQAIEPTTIVNMFQHPLGQWNGDGNALDSSGLANHGTLSSNAGYANGQCDLGFALDTPGATVTIPGQPDISVKSDELTFAAWIRADQASDLQQIFRKEGDPDNTFDRVLRLTLEDGLLTFSAGIQANFGTRIATDLGDLRDGRVHFIALSVGGVSNDDLTLWVDGNSQLFTFGMDDVEIGELDIVLGGDAGGPEVLDEVIFFNGILTENRIAAIRQICLQALFADGFESGDTSVWSTTVP